MALSIIFLFQASNVLYYNFLENGVVMQYDNSKITVIIPTL